MTGSSEIGTSFSRRVAQALLVAAALATLAGCGNKRDRPRRALAGSLVTAIGVNSYLWRASLETLAFMPLSQADSSGGVIVTDWYANPDNPGEGVKVSVVRID